MIKNSLQFEVLLFIKLFAGEDLVPEPADQVEETEPRAGRELWQPAVPRALARLRLPAFWSRSAPALPCRALLPPPRLPLLGRGGRNGRQPAHLPGLPPPPPTATAGQAGFAA